MKDLLIWFFIPKLWQIVNVYIIIIYKSVNIYYIMII